MSPSLKTVISPRPNNITTPTVREHNEARTNGLVSELIDMSPFSRNGCTPALSQLSETDEAICLQSFSWDSSQHSEGDRNLKKDLGPLGILRSTRL